MLRALGRVTLEAGELENWLSLLVLVLDGQDPWDWQAAGHDLVSKKSADQLRKRLRELSARWPAFEADIRTWEKEVRAVLQRRHDIVHGYPLLRRKGKGLEMVYRNPRSRSIGVRDAATLSTLADDLRRTHARGATLLVRIRLPAP